MAIDTIFLCFLEDSSRNDGINKPYFMSRVIIIIIYLGIIMIIMGYLIYKHHPFFQDLMQFVENSKKALDALEHKDEIKQNENKHMMVQERRRSDDSIAMIDVD